MPVPGCGQLAHRGADVGVQVVPHDHQRPVELLVRVIEQPGVIAFGEPLALIAASVAAVHAVDQPSPAAGLDRGRPRSLAIFTSAG